MAHFKRTSLKIIIIIDFSSRLDFFWDMPVKLHINLLARRNTDKMVPLLAIFLSVNISSFPSGQHEVKGGLHEFRISKEH